MTRLTRSARSALATTFAAFTTLTLFTALFISPTVAAAGQESLSSARDLYASAKYEDALVVLDRLRVVEPSTDEAHAIDQYRIFCLLALGRAADAERAIEAVVRSEPLYQPSNADVSPRLRTAFTDVRKKVLPSIVQQRYQTAKTAFDRKEWGDAESGFKQVLDVLGDPDIASAASQLPLADLKTLAAGFHDLSATAAAPPPPPPPPPPPVEPKPEPAPSVPRPPRIYTLSDPGVVAPIAVRQTLPPFPTQASALTPSLGALEVVIDEHGAVESAVMRSPLTATYDRQVIAAARAWQYKPATLDGVPVKFRKMVQITVKR